MPKKKTDKRVMLLDPEECAIILNDAEVKAIFSQKAEKDMKAPLSENEKLILALEVLLQDEEFIKYLMENAEMILSQFMTSEEYFEEILAQTSIQKESSADKIKRILKKKDASVEDLNEMIKEIFKDDN